MVSFLAIPFLDHAHTRLCHRVSAGSSSRSTRDFRIDFQRVFFDRFLWDFRVDRLPRISSIVVRQAFDFFHRLPDRLPRRSSFVRRSLPSSSGSASASIVVRDSDTDLQFDTVIADSDFAIDFFAIQTRINQIQIADSFAIDILCVCDSDTWINLCYSDTRRHGLIFAIN
ncbi:hypothetical protein ZOSMA_249G00190 [Zostera marina]|uniref:Uncharacterized protein n=1 Tax=Zostera marina TaxID=29655 RepID=A0A0K9PGI6_ZOSMR|nr:hypothetical protein ZOSMA_249G00190 [Zostera marina]